ncbi:MAG: hypothetical protein FJZ15_04080, partial [Candidatus Omnitrophica bacterium]|nr:hypothetical protein [Candidatus Omnitrophota bacterium]
MAVASDKVKSQREGLSKEARLSLTTEDIAFCIHRERKLITKLEIGISPFTISTLHSLILSFASKENFTFDNVLSDDEDRFASFVKLFFNSERLEQVRKIILAVENINNPRGEQISNKLSYVKLVPKVIFSGNGQDERKIDGEAISVFRHNLRLIRLRGETADVIKKQRPNIQFGKDKKRHVEIHNIISDDLGTAMHREGSFITCLETGDRAAQPTITTIHSLIIAFSKEDKFRLDDIPSKTKDRFSVLLGLLFDIKSPQDTKAMLEGFQRIDNIACSEKVLSKTAKSAFIFKQNLRRLIWQERFLEPKILASKLHISPDGLKHYVKNGNSINIIKIHNLILTIAQLKGLTFKDVLGKLLDNMLPTSVEYLQASGFMGSRAPGMLRNAFFADGSGAERFGMQEGLNKIEPMEYVIDTIISSSSYESGIGHYSIKPKKEMKLGQVLDYLEQHPNDHYMFHYLESLQIEDDAEEVGEVLRRFKIKPSSILLGLLLDVNITKFTEVKSALEGYLTSNKETAISLLEVHHPSRLVRAKVIRQAESKAKTILGQIFQINRNNFIPLASILGKIPLPIYPDTLIKLQQEFARKFVSLPELPGISGEASEMHYCTGTGLRSKKPSETLKLLEPIISSLEITPHCDTIEGKVSICAVKWKFSTNAILGRNNYVISGINGSGGKGLYLTAALSSGLMETVERYSAEIGSTDNWPNGYEEKLEFIYGNASDLKNNNLTILNPNQINPLVPYEDQPISWVKGHILTQKGFEDIYVPNQMVFLMPNFDEVEVLQDSSNGLAAGNTMNEAKLHALLEIIERDSDRTMFYSPEKTFYVTAENKNIKGLLDLFEKEGVVLELLDLTSEFGVPAYRALIRTQNSMISGSGAHLDGSIAAIRAICELFGKFLMYPAKERDKMNRNKDKAMAINTIENLPNFSSGNIDLDLKRVEELLLANNYYPIYVNLTRADWKIPVVRAIVPGLGIPEGLSIRQLAHLFKMSGNCQLLSFEQKNDQGKIGAVVGGKGTQAAQGGSWSGVIQYHPDDMFVVTPIERLKLSGYIGWQPGMPRNMFFADGSGIKAFTAEQRALIEKTASSLRQGRVSPVKIALSCQHTLIFGKLKISNVGTYLRYEEKRRGVYIAAIKLTKEAKLLRVTLLIPDQSCQLHEVPCGDIKCDDDGFPLSQKVTDKQNTLNISLSNLLFQEGYPEELFILTNGEQHIFKMANLSCSLNGFLISKQLKAHDVMIARYLPAEGYRRIEIRRRLGVSLTEGEKLAEFEVNEKSYPVQLEKGKISMSLLDYLRKTGQINDEPQKQTAKAPKGRFMFSDIDAYARYLQRRYSAEKAEIKIIKGKGSYEVTASLTTAEGQIQEVSCGVIKLDANGFPAFMNVTDATKTRWISLRWALLRGGYPEELFIFTSQSKQIFQIAGIIFYLTTYLRYRKLESADVAIVMYLPAEGYRRIEIRRRIGVSLTEGEKLAEFEVNEKGCPIKLPAGRISTSVFDYLKLIGQISEDSHRNEITVGRSQDLATIGKIHYGWLLRYFAYLEFIGIADVRSLIMRLKPDRVEVCACIGEEEKIMHSVKLDEKNIPVNFPADNMAGVSLLRILDLQGQLDKDLLAAFRRSRDAKKRYEFPEEALGALQIRRQEMGEESISVSGLDRNQEDGGDRTLYSACLEFGIELKGTRRSYSTTQVRQRELARRAALPGGEMNNTPMALQRPKSEGGDWSLYRSCIADPSIELPQSERPERPAVLDAFTHHFATFFAGELSAESYLFQLWERAINAGEKQDRDYFILGMLPLVRDVIEKELRVNSIDPQGKGASLMDYLLHRGSIALVERMSEWPSSNEADTLFSWFRTMLNEELLQAKKDYFREIEQAAWRPSLDETPEDMTAADTVVSKGVSPLEEAIANEVDGLPSISQVEKDNLLQDLRRFFSVNGLFRDFGDGADYQWALYVIGSLGKKNKAKKGYSDLNLVLLSDAPGEFLDLTLEDLARDFDAELYNQKGSLPVIGIGQDGEYNSIKNGLSTNGNMTFIQKFINILRLAGVGCQDKGFATVEAISVNQESELQRLMHVFIEVGSLELTLIPENGILLLESSQNSNVILRKALLENLVRQYSGADADSKSIQLFKENLLWANSGAFGAVVAGKG